MAMSDKPGSASRREPYKLADRRDVERDDRSMRRGVAESPTAPSKTSNDSNARSRIHNELRVVFRSVIKRAQMKIREEAIFEAQKQLSRDKESYGSKWAEFPSVKEMVEARQSGIDDRLEKMTQALVANHGELDKAIGSCVDAAVDHIAKEVVTKPRSRPSDALEARLKVVEKTSQEQRSQFDKERKQFQDAYDKMMKELKDLKDREAQSTRQNKETRQLHDKRLIDQQSKLTKDNDELKALVKSLGSDVKKQASQIKSLESDLAAAKNDISGANDVAATAKADAVEAKGQAVLAKAQAQRAVTKVTSLETDEANSKTPSTDLKITEMQQEVEQLCKFRAETNGKTSDMWDEIAKHEEIFKNVRKDLHQLQTDMPSQSSIPDEIRELQAEIQSESAKRSAEVAMAREEVLELLEKHKHKTDTSVAQEAPRQLSEKLEGEVSRLQNLVCNEATRRETEIGEVKTALKGGLNATSQKLAGLAEHLSKVDKHLERLDLDICSIRKLQEPQKESSKNHSNDLSTTKSQVVLTDEQMRQAFKLYAQHHEKVHDELAKDFGSQVDHLNRRVEEIEESMKIKTASANSDVAKKLASDAEDEVDSNAARDPDWNTDEARAQAMEHLKRKGPPNSPSPNAVTVDIAGIQWEIDALKARVDSLPQLDRNQTVQPDGTAAILSQELHQLRDRVQQVVDSLALLGQEKDRLVYNFRYFKSEKYFSQLFHRFREEFKSYASGQPTPPLTAIAQPQIPGPHRPQSAGPNQAASYPSGGLNYGQQMHQLQQTGPHQAGPYGGLTFGQMQQVHQPQQTYQHLQQAPPQMDQRHQVPGRVVTSAAPVLSSPPMAPPNMSPAAGPSGNGTPTGSRKRPRGDES